MELQENLNVLESIVDSYHPIHKSWTERIEARDEEWELARPRIFDALMRRNYVDCDQVRNQTVYNCWSLLLLQKCSICLTSIGVIRCHQCGSGYILCEECDVKLHQDCTIHDRVAWIDGCFRHIPPTQTIKMNCLYQEGMYNCTYTYIHAFAID